MNRTTPVRRVTLPLSLSIEIGLILLLLWTPLPFGSVRPGALFTIQQVAAILGVASLVLLYLEPQRLSRSARRLLKLLLAIMLIGVLQLLPVGSAWASLFASDFAELRRSLAETIPISTATRAHLSLPAGVDALTRFASYLLVGLAATTIATEAVKRRLILAITLSATFQALYGAFELISGRDQILGYAKEFYLNEATGTFINRNHFASYLAAAIPLALALIYRPRRQSGFPGWRHRLITWLKRSSISRLWGCVAVACCWIGVVLSYSRAGFAVALLGVVTLAMLVWRRRSAVLLLVVLLSIPTLFLLAKEVRSPGTRFERLSADVQSESGRWPVWQATGRMAIEHPLLGVGFGGFDSAFPLYRPAAIQVRWQHAHNDWLQLAAEGGFLALLLMLAAAATLLWPPRRIDIDGKQFAIEIALFASLLVVALHSFVDFPLKIPAIAVLTAAVIGMRVAKREPA